MIPSTYSYMKKMAERNKGNCLNLSNTKFMQILSENALLFGLIDDYDESQQYAREFFRLRQITWRRRLFSCGGPLSGGSTHFPEVGWGYIRRCGDGAGPDLSRPRARAVLARETRGTRQNFPRDRRACGVLTVILLPLFAG